jgi:hypothetical protein
MRLLWLVPLILLSSGALGSTPETFRLKMSDGEKYTFSAVSDARSLGGFYGAYQAPRSYTNGTSVKLYPNMRFTVMSWCDICRPSLLANGTYSFTNGVIDLVYTEKEQKRSDAELPAKLAVFHGEIEKKGYVTGFEMILIKPEDVRAASTSEDFNGYLALQNSYPDWQAMYDDEVSGK